MQVLTKRVKKQPFEDALIELAESDDNGEMTLNATKKNMEKVKKKLQINNMKWKSSELAQDKMEQIAIKNYEKFFSLQPGTVSLKQVKHTKLGIEGFSKMNLDEELPEKVNENERT